MLEPACSLQAPICTMAEPPGDSRDAGTQTRIVAMEPGDFDDLEEKMPVDQLGVPPAKAEGAPRPQDILLEKFQIRKQTLLLVF